MQIKDKDFLEIWKVISKRPNVVGFDTNDQEIRVFVSRKIPISQVIKTPSIWYKIKRKILRKHNPFLEEELLPSEINGKEIEIIEIGEVEAPRPIPFSTQSTTEKFRPLESGISAMHYKGTGCTLTGLFREKETGKLYFGSNNHCFIKNSKVFSNPSLIDFDEAEKVKSISGYTKVTNHFSRFYDGPIISINFRGKKIGCTPEHPILTISPEKIYSYSYREYPKYNLTNKQWKEAKDLQKFDLLLIPKNNQKSKEINLEFAKWLGFYIAEGSISNHGSSKTINLDNFKRSTLIPYLSFFGGKMIEEERTEGILYRIKIYNTKLANWLLRVIGMEKRIPKFILNSGPKSKLAFLTGMLEGDGHIRGNSYTIFTKSSDLCDDFYALLISVNIVPSYWQEIQDHDYKGYKWTSNIHYLQWSNHPRIYSDEKFLYVPIYQIIKTYYKGIVKNLETEDNTYCVPFLVHNCFAEENKAEVGDPIWQPSPYDGGTEKDRIGKYSKCIPILFEGFKCPFRNFFFRIYKFFKRQLEFNRVDVGYASIDCTFTEHSCDVLQNLCAIKVNQIGLPKGKRIPNLGEEVQKTGRTTGHTIGKVISLSWTGRIGYSRGQALFTDCILIEGDFSKGGDSGSPVYDMNGNFIGVLFAGSSTHTIVCKWNNIEQESGMEIVLSEHLEVKLDGSNV